MASVQAGEGISTVLALMEDRSVVCVDLLNEKLPARKTKCANGQRCDFTPYQGDFDTLLHVIEPK